MTSITTSSSADHLDEAASRRAATASLTYLPHEHRVAQARQVSQMEEYQFDLRGCLVLRNAVSLEHIDRLNTIIDKLMAVDPPLKNGEWYGHIWTHNYGGAEGINFQQIYEAGLPFEELIDHPSWINHILHFVGGKGTFDGHHGPLFIDECFANVREEGQAIGLHSGGHKLTKRTMYNYKNSQFGCCQVNILMALSDIGPGDGGTMIIPGSHKANFPHPQIDTHSMKQGETRSMDGVEGAIEVHMKKGDALLFTDSINHGSAKRVNPGQRRILVQRYGPSWGTFRHPVRPSDELLARLTPLRKSIVMPQVPIPRVPNRLED
jgi:hypothetical protein